MPTEQQMKEVLQSYIDAFKARDAEWLGSLFAEDATIEDPVGSDPVRGSEAIAAMYREGVRLVTRIDLAAPIRGSHTNAAAMAFDFEMDLDGTTVSTSTIDVMEFDESGKIRHLRAYWGPSDTSMPAAGQ